MKKITLILLAFITITNIANSQALKFTSKGRKYLRSIENSGLTYINYGEPYIDSIIKNSLSKSWSGSKIYFENSSNGNQIRNSNFNILFRKHSYEITNQRTSTISNIYKFENEYIYILSKEKHNSGIEKLNINTTVFRKTINSYGKYESIKHEFYEKMIPYCIKALNDCYQTIIDYPDINNFQKIYDKINETNAYKTKGKTILFLEDENNYTKNGWINFNNFDKLDIKYKVVSFNEFKNFTKEELSKYVLVSYGRDPLMIFTLQDPITMDLLYINQYMNLGGSITKGRLKEFQSYLK